MKNEEMLIQGEMTVLGAMQRLDVTAKKVLFIVDAERRLQAAVTDGDVRRWILAKGDLDAPIRYAANFHPKYLDEESADLALPYMEKEKIDAVPILDGDHKIVRIIMASNGQKQQFTNELKGVSVVIMAGGLGTRLYPYTRILPKPLIPVGDVPIIEHIMNGFHRYGCNDFYLVVNHKKNMIKAYFGESGLGYNVMYVDEDIPLGTGGGLSLLKGRINSTFILSNCDILIKDNIAAAYRLHKTQGNFITMICSAKNFTIPYGVVNIDDTGNIKEIEEKPSLSFLTNTGCYVVDPEVVDSLEANVPVGFPEIIEQYIARGKKVGIYPISENAWMDMGQLDGLKDMELKMREIRVDGETGYQEWKI